MGSIMNTDIKKCLTNNRTYVLTTLDLSLNPWIDLQVVKADIKAISSDTYQLQYLKLYHFKLELF